MMAVLRGLLWTILLSAVQGYFFQRKIEHHDLKKTVTGILLLLFGFVLAVVSALFFVVTLFLYLAEAVNLVTPAIWTGVLSAGVAALFFVWGLATFKKSAGGV